MTSLNLQLVHAILSDNSSRIRELAQLEGIDVNDKGFFSFPPLLRAALYGKSEAFKALIEVGADRNALDSQGRTALQLARKYNHPHIVEILQQTDRGYF